METYFEKQSETWLMKTKTEKFIPYVSSIKECYYQFMKDEQLDEEEFKYEYFLKHYKAVLQKK